MKTPDVLPPLPLSLRLPPESAPLRLDAALGRALPGLGLRARRRLWDWCRVLVNGKERAPGFMVAAGDEIRVEAGSRRVADQAPCAEAARCAEKTPCVEKVLGAVTVFFAPEALRLLELTPDFAAFAKPAALHSAHVAASPEASFEALLPSLWPELCRRRREERGGNAAADQDAPAPEILLTRLDKATSGILLAARNAGAAARFRRDEARGLVNKRYLALVRGRLSGPLHLDGRLLTTGGAVCSVSGRSDPDPARHTFVEVLAHADMKEGRPRPDAAGPCTLVLARIGRGARHQVRAHLAGAGFPIAGDDLYGGAVSGEEAGLFLHHAALDFPGFSARCPAPWLADWPAGLGPL